MAKRSRPEDFLAAFQKLNLSTQKTFTFETRRAEPPTWDQLKKLTQEAEGVVQQARQPKTSLTLFLAMLAVVNCQITAGEFTYWAYIPFPPLYQGVAWGDKEVLVFTNDTAWMPSPL